ncbi:MAG: hypothetical protein CMB80_25890 [Flammeovirgaceae bacterium]|nr:hypothetical protein [Flammeovirgaceae bacterium]MBE62177.1 hypothetical protein [Flammeovirgaceae bacterium]
MPGLGLRITPKGTKTFIYYYYYQSEKRYRTKTYGKYPVVSLADARARWAEDVVKLGFGEDPASEQIEANKQDRDVPSVKSLVDEYEEHLRIAGRKEQYIKSIIGYLRRDFVRLKGHKRVNKLTQADIREVNNEPLSRGSPGAAFEAWTHIRRVLNLSIKWYDGIKENPAIAVGRPAKKGTRTRVLSPVEIWRFWHGINNTEINPIIRAALKMMFVTLQRGSEVRQAEWCHLLENEPIWEVPDENAKNEIFHRVPLNRYALELINEMGSYTRASPYIFGISPFHKQKATPDRVDLNVMNHGALSENVIANYGDWGTAHFTPHDLRRTATTTLTGVGVPRFFVKMLLNHVDDDGATPIYDRYTYDYEKKKAAEAWAFTLDQILSAKTAQEVPAIIDLRIRLRKSKIMQG